MIRLFFIPFLLKTFLKNNSFDITTLHESISLTKCKTIMEKDGTKYTEQEIKEIRAFLFKLADMDYQIFLKQKLREEEFKNINAQPINANSNIIQSEQ